MELKFMILFHGTTEENIKNIKKVGLLNSTNDPWIVEVTGKNVCCVSNEPTSGEGGSPIYFAGRHERSNNQNGYLVVLSINQQVFTKKLVTIFDNKVLDDYVIHHFFIRDEFNFLGYQLYQILDKEKENIPSFINKNLKTIVCEKPMFDYSQKTYFKNIPEFSQNKSYQLQDLQISNAFISFIKNVGSWENFYHFLCVHFSHIEKKAYDKFFQKFPKNSGKYWSDFYHHFPCNIQSKRQEHFNLWFSPKWLEQRQLSVPNNNSQILMMPIEPEYIAGFIHVTNSSGIVPRFRPIKRRHKTQAKYTLAKRIWRQVYRITTNL